MFYILAEFEALVNEDFDLRSIISQRMRVGIGDQLKRTLESGGSKAPVSLDRMRGCTLEILKIDGDQVTLKVTATPPPTWAYSNDKIRIGQEHIFPKSFIRKRFFEAA